MKRRWQLFKDALREARERENVEREKERLLSHDMDFAFLERIVRDINENPNLHVHISLRDGTQIDLNTIPRKLTIGETMEPLEEMRVIE